MRYFCSPKRELSSAGSEHLPYKQRVTGSNPVAPTRKKEHGRRPSKRRKNRSEFTRERFFYALWPLGLQGLMCAFSLKYPPKRITERSEVIL